MKLKLMLPVVLLLTLLSSCRNTPEQPAVKDANKLQLPKEISGNWYVVNKVKNSYEIIDCGYTGESIQVQADSVLHKDIMEDTSFKTHHVKYDNGSILIFPNSAENTFYKFSWENRQEGISKWEIWYAGGSVMVKYAVHESGLKNVKRVKGTKGDCITDDETTAATDSFEVNDGKTHTSVENGNCLTIRNDRDAMLFEHCFTDGSMVEVRDIKGTYLPLTFNNGPHAIEADFYRQGTRWVAKSITLYKHTPNGHVKQTKAITVTLTDFDFGTVAGL